MYLSTSFQKDRYLKLVHPHRRRQEFFCGEHRLRLMALVLAGLLGALTQSGCRQSAKSDPENKSQETVESPTGKVIFREMDASGFQFTHHVGDLSEYHFPDIMVGGCGVIDFDRDGLLDLILVDSGDLAEEWNTVPATERTSGRNRIFRQEKPGKFLDVTESLGISDSGYGSGVGVADINNDGYDDIYFSNFGEDKLYLNEGGKSFREVTKAAGLSNPSWGTSVTFLDYDLDGRLDLFVTNYVSYIAETNCANAGDAEDFCSPGVFERTVDKLFRNVSDGGQIKFVDVTVEMGIAVKKGPGLGVISRDFNGDGYPDIYVANDGWENFLWINKAGQSFEEQASQLGCAMGLKGDAQAGMGVAEGDLDFNKVSDIVVTHLDGETNAAYFGNLQKINQQTQLFFSESGGAKGVQKISKPMTGFGIALTDVDNDGDLDMLTANGRVTRRQRVPGEDFWSDYAERNQISINQGQGKFKEMDSGRDDFVRDVAVSRGLSLADFDNDGKMDCLVVNAGGEARLYENQCEDSGNWIGFSVIDPEKGGRATLNAKVVLEFKDGHSDQRFVQTDGSYLSANDSRVHFGLGARETVDRIVVYWPDGQREAFQFSNINQYFTVRKGEGNSIE